MSASPTQVLEAFVTNIRSLASNDNYKAIAGAFDKIPQLNAEISSKDTEIDSLKAEITSLKATHKNHVQENLETYCKQRDDFKKEKAQLSKKISTLEADIQEKVVTTTEHHQTEDLLRRQLDLANKSLDEEKKTMMNANAAITKLQQSMKGKDTGIDKLREGLHNEKAQVSKFQSQLQETLKEKTSLEHELQSSTTRLREIEGFTAKLHEGDEAVWIGRLDEVWESAHRLVDSIFKEDLTEKCLRDTSAWKNLRDSPHLDRGLPLPQSNSPAAKNMRIAAILAILARCIDLHVFQPSHLLDEEDEIRPLLVRQAMANSKKESFCRAVLLSMFSEDQARNAAKGIERVVREVPWCVRNLLSDAQYDSFRLGLEHVVKQAYHAWQLIQSATEKFEPLFKLKHFEGIEWQMLSLDEDGAGAKEQSMVQTPEGDEALLVIFPRIYIIEDNEPEPITHGVALMKSQSIAAAAEIERRSPPSPTTGRPGPRSRAIRSRTLSISSNGGNDFLSKRTPSAAH
ncbi:MAG: hypothetical protein M1830_000360 [Pleopsidium flavum]|nr:MAG: hypothetical protein M1830_000360 [Pleopsidium flavum]